MQGKRVSETSVIMVQPMSPQEANTAGNVQGGTIMKLIDLAGGIVAQRHTRMNGVTASAFLTYVALDKSGRPVEVPPLILETAEDERRNEDARARREVRLRGRIRRE